MSSPPADSAQIRSRLLNRLGIYDAPPGSTSSTAGPPFAGSKTTVQHRQQPMTAAQIRRLRILRGMGVGYNLNLYHHSPPDGSAIRPPLDGVVPFQEPLKSNDEKPSRHNRSQSDSMLSAMTETAFESDPQDNNRLGNLSATNSPSRKTKKKIAFQDEVQVVPIPTRYEYSDRIKSRIWSSRHELQANAERNALEFAAEGWNWRNVTEDDGMYICSVSGELVHPIHLQHLVDSNANGNSPATEGNENQEGGPETSQNDPAHVGVDGSIDRPEDDEEEDHHTPLRGLERGTPVHSTG